MIEILLSSYNGEKYIKELLDSLLSQSYTNWQLVVRDDGSQDSTLKIINEYKKVYPDKIKILHDGGDNLGSTFSFSRLFENSKCEYIMLCDQDDIWLPQKIELTFDEMLKLEENYKDIPLMIFTDLKEVDENLNIISESFMKSQKLFPSIILNPKKLVALNVVAGCTTLINRKAIEYILPFPSANIIHDQWMAINIAKYGKIQYLPKATILYRQHSSNVLGSYKIGIRYFYKKIKNPLKQIRIYRNLLSNLSFKVSILEFIFYKLLFTIKRSI
jgi:glycosyltransferase involved in cell wall biosynthesis